MQFSTLHLNCLLGSHHLPTMFTLLFWGNMYICACAHAAITQARLERVSFLSSPCVRLDLGTRALFIVAVSGETLGRV